MQQVRKLDLQALAEAVLLQRQERMNDSGPGLRGLGSARFQVSSTQLHIANAQIRDGKTDDFVNRIIHFAYDRHLAISWNVASLHSAPDTIPTLLSHGFRVNETLRLMGRIGGLIQLPPQPGVTVDLVASINEMQEYERISAWGFNDIEHPSSERLLVKGRERWDEQQARWYQYYVGKLNGVIAGGAYISLWERVPTIYGVVTAPPARRHSIAAQVMYRLVQDTLQLGYPWTCLYVRVENPAENLYQLLGYTFLFEMTTLHWGAVA